MRGSTATACHPATGSARRRSKILSPPRNFARWLGQQKLVTLARSGSPCASGSQNSMPLGMLVRRGGGRGPRVPVSSYSTPMLGRRYPTSSPSARPRRGRRGPASVLNPQRDHFGPFRLRAVLTHEPPAPHLEPGSKHCHSLAGPFQCEIVAQAGSRRLAEGGIRHCAGSGNEHPHWRFHGRGGVVVPVSRSCSADRL